MYTLEIKVCKHISQQYLEPCFWYAILFNVTVK